MLLDVTLPGSTVKIDQAVRFVPVSDPLRLFSAQIEVPLGVQVALVALGSVTVLAKEAVQGPRGSWDPLPLLQTLPGPCPRPVGL